MFFDQDLLDILAAEGNFWKSYDACMMTELAQDFPDSNSDSAQYQTPTPLVSAATENCHTRCRTTSNNQVFNWKDTSQRAARSR